jgi:microcystin-dependent protein
MPAHRHGIVAVDTDAADSKPTNQMMPAASEMYAPVPSSNNASQMNGSFLGSRGGGQPHPNQMPYVVMTYIMAAQGIFPPRA